MKHMDDEIEKTLNSLQGLSKATPGEGFESELLQKLSFLPEQRTWLRYLRYGVAAMIVLGLTNIFALFSVFSSSGNEDLSSEITTEFLDSSTYFFDYTD